MEVSPRFVRVDFHGVGGTFGRGQHRRVPPPQCPFRDVDDTPFDWAVIYLCRNCYVLSASTAMFIRLLDKF